MVFLYHLINFTLSFLHIKPLKNFYIKKNLLHILNFYSITYGCFEFILSILIAQSKLFYAFYAL